VNRIWLKWALLALAGLAVLSEQASSLLCLERGWTRIACFFLDLADESDRDPAPQRSVL
jgi:hypothetical protein